MAGKQVEFDGLQGHDKGVERAVVIFSIACIVFVVICIQLVAGA